MAGLRVLVGSGAGRGSRPNGAEGLVEASTPDVEHIQGGQEVQTQLERRLGVSARVRIIL